VDYNGHLVGGAISTLFRRQALRGHTLTGNSLTKVHDYVKQDMI